MSYEVGWRGPGNSEFTAVADIAFLMAVYVVDGTVPLAHGSRIQDSWNRDAVQVPLDRTAIKRIDTNRRAGHYPLGIDFPRSRSWAISSFGMKSSCGDSR